MLMKMQDLINIRRSQNTEVKGSGLRGTDMKLNTEAYVDVELFSWEMGYKILARLLRENISMLEH